MVGIYNIFPKNQDVFCHLNLQISDFKYIKFCLISSFFHFQPKHYFYWHVLTSLELNSSNNFGTKLWNSGHSGSVKKFHFRKQPETLKTCAFVRQGKLIPLLFNALHKINTQLFSPCISIWEFHENVKSEIENLSHGK